MGKCFSRFLSWFDSGRNRREDSNGRQRRKNEDRLQRMAQATSSSSGQFVKHKVSKNKRDSSQKRSALQDEIRSREVNATSKVGRRIKSPNRRRPVHDDEETLLESEYGGWSSEPSLSIHNEERRRNYKVVSGSSEMLAKGGATAGRKSRSTYPSQRHTLSEPSLTDVKPNECQTTRQIPRSARQMSYVIRSDKSLTEKNSKNNGTNVMQCLEDVRKVQVNGRAKEKEVNIQQSKAFGMKLNGTKTSETVTTRQATATSIYLLSGKMTATAAGPDRSTEFADSKPEKITEGPQSNKRVQGTVELQTAALRNSDKCLAISKFSDQDLGNHKSTNLENRRANKVEDKIQPQQINNATVRNYNWPQITTEELSTRDVHDQTITKTEISMGIRNNGRTTLQDLQKIPNLIRNSNNDRNNYLNHPKESLNLKKDRNREDDKPRRLEEITGVVVSENSRKQHLWGNGVQNQETSNEENLGEDELGRHESISKIKIAEEASNNTLTSPIHGNNNKHDGRVSKIHRFESNEADNQKKFQNFEDSRKGQGNGGEIENEVNIQHEIQSKASGIDTSDTKTSIPSGVDAMLHKSKKPVKIDQSKSTDVCVLDGKMMASAAPSFQKATERVTTRQATATCVYPLGGKMTATAARPDRSTEFNASEPEKVTEGPQSNQSYQGMVELQTEETSDRTVTSPMNGISNTNDGRENKKRRSDYDEADNLVKKFHRDTPGVQFMSSTKDENIYQDTAIQTDRHVVNQGPMEAVSLQNVPYVANENIQKLSEKEVSILKRIEIFFEESRKFEMLVNEFVGAVGTQEHYYIDESLARLLLDLDDLGVLKNETLKLERRKVIKYIYHLLDILEERSTTV